MRPQTVEPTTAVAHFKSAHLPAILTLAAGLLLGSPLLAEPFDSPGACDLAGTWYGGSVVAYHMTIIPAGDRDHYTAFAQGMYKNSVMNTVYTGQLARKHNRYEGPLMQLSTADEDFLNPPPIGKLPDITAGWSSMRLVDCNTIENRIPFFGVYFASSIWQPDRDLPVIDWTGVKTPLVSPPDVDLLIILSGGRPIVETYHRLLKTVNPDLLHK
jgi:hypothetical protein